MGAKKAAAPRPEAAGNKRKRRSKVTTVVDEGDCSTCSSCQSRLLRVADAHRLGELNFVRPSSESALSCAACGSVLTPLRDLVR
ncbi:putative Zn-finger protein [Equine parapoxvirus]|nr:putative Zn-finger protein [Equine parapoxvirus]WOC35526.1 putative Zn-finger protein [Equine parapoxvirus]